MLEVLAPVPLLPAVTMSLADAVACADEFLQASKSAATRRAYAADARDFRVWCAQHGLAPLPAEPATAAAYFAALARQGLRPSTITRRAAAIRFVHKAAGLEPPTNSEAVKAVLSGIRRSKGTAVTRKAPATAPAVAAMIDGLTGLGGVRDRALLVLGFAAALRRSELVALDVADLEHTEDGLIVHIRRSKTDQEGAGDFVSIPRGTRLRPVLVVKAWLDAAGITEGPIFRPVAKGDRLLPARLTDRSVAAIVKRRAKDAGLDPRVFSGHSLRAGFVTSALASGADVLRVMDVTRHREVRTLKAYDRRAKAFQDHAGASFL
jgi:site-specific recombinase XerD